MPTSAELLAATDALKPLRPQDREAIAACARIAVFAPEELLMHEGRDADAFVIILEGAVALETVVPGRGSVTIETLHDGELLGWSWIVPPHRTAFDARALRTTRAIVVDAACLREACERDPALGYGTLKLLAAMFAVRLRDTRLRLLDLYGARTDD